LLGGYIDTILDILRDKEYEIDKISIYEYMFFVSAIGVEYEFNINADKAVELIKEYRRLTPIQRRSVIETLKMELKPKNFMERNQIKEISIIGKQSCTGILSFKSNGIF